MVFSPFRCVVGAVSAALMLLMASSASAQARALFEDSGSGTVEWKEADVSLPAYPVDASLIPLQVGPAGNVTFFIDQKSMTLADDGVVRFTLVARSSVGAENVSFEGIRCETAERKLYAIGRKPGEWVRSRNTDWQRIEEKSINRVHAALTKEYFCPPGSIRPNLEQILNALRRDGGVR